MTLEYYEGRTIRGAILLRRTDRVEVASRWEGTFKCRHGMQRTSHARQAAHGVPDIRPEVCVRVCGACVSWAQDGAREHGGRAGRVGRCTAGRHCQGPLARLTSPCVHLHTAHAYHITSHHITSHRHSCFGGGALPGSTASLPACRAAAPSAALVACAGDPTRRACGASLGHRLSRRLDALRDAGEEPLRPCARHAMANCIGRKRRRHVHARAAIAIHMLLVSS